MGEPFIGSEVLGCGALNRYQLRTQYRAILPGIYLDKRLTPSLSNRTKAAWLWSGREAVVSGLAASALHGSKWIDGESDIELVYANTRPPGGVVTSNDTLLDGEVQIIDGMKVTTPERTAFDIARRGRLGHAVARLDSLAAATGFKAPHVQELAARHRHVRGLRQLEAALGLVDAGAQSPKETWLRLVLIRAGFPRPQTQIPIYDDDGYPIAFLDMGWEGPKVAAEYDGDQHRTDRRQYVKDIRRLDLLRRLGWNIIRVVAEDHADDVVYRVGRALTSRSG
jgi:hypothetical protein